MFDVPESKYSDIYIWTAPTPDGELVYYTGETARRFSTRMKEHLMCQLSGLYRVYNPSLFLQGNKQLLWGGMFGKNREKGLSHFVSRLPELGTHLIEFVRLMRFHLAPYNGEELIRKRMEAALADHFYAQPGIAGGFQDADIHYDRTRLTEEPIDISIKWLGRIVGAPVNLFVCNKETI